MRLWFNGALATCLFELRRSFTFQRTAVSLILAAFPPLMVTLLIVTTQVAKQAAIGEHGSVDDDVVDSREQRGDPRAVNDEQRLERLGRNDQ